LSRAYPLAYEASRLDDPGVFNGLFAGLAAPSGVRLPSVEYDWEDAPEDWSPSATNVCIVNIEWATDGTIQDVDIEGRGNTLLNTRGHRVPSHIAVEPAVRTPVIRRTASDAMGRMIDLANRIRNLATWPNTDRLGSSVDPKGIYAKAYADFGAAIDAATDA